MKDEEIRTELDLKNFIIFLLFLLVVILFVVYLMPKSVITSLNIAISGIFH